MPFYHGEGSLTPTAKRIERLEALYRMFLSTYGPHHHITIAASYRLAAARQAGGQS